MAAANGLIDAAEATGNPFVLSFALLAYGYRLPRRRSRPRARGPAPGPGDRPRQRQPLRSSHTLAAVCARLEAEHGDPMAAFDYFTVAIRNYHDSGNTAMIRIPLAYPRRLSRPARTLRTGGHHRRVRASVPSLQRPCPRSAPRSPTSAMSSARQTYESLARKGETMTTAAMVTYAYDQIDQARAELNAVSK